MRHASKSYTLEIGASLLFLKSKVAKIAHNVISSSAFKRLSVLAFFKFA